MNYTEALDYLSIIDKKYGISYGLETVKVLFEKTHNPEKYTKIIHVAGTNGKGSVSSFITYILSAAGYTVGRYVSPAVYGYREKVQYVKDCHTEYISEEEVSKYINTLKEYADEMYKTQNMHPSAFEIETVMAAMAFKDWKCDYAVVECGMGGLLDATNVIHDKELCVFASISEDHKSYLGDMLSDITRNKAGIMRKNVNAVSVKQNKEAADILAEYAADVGCRLIFTDDYEITDTDISGSSFRYKGRDWNIGLCGTFQIENAVTAIEAVYALPDIKDTISYDIIKNGLYKTRWPGRFEIINNSPYVIADGAHNPDAAAKLVKSIDALFPHEKYKRIGIVGIFKDKEIDKMLGSIKGCFDEIHTVTPPGVRGLDACELAERITHITGITAMPHSDMSADETAEDIIKSTENDETVIIIFGSLSLRSKK